MTKKNKLSVIAFIIGVLAFASCQKDPAPTTGSTGSDRDRFIFTWRSQERSQQYGSTTTFNIKIKTDTVNSSGIIIEEMYQLPHSKTRAIVNGNYFNIPFQIVSGNAIEGSGYMQSLTTMTMKYSVNSGGITDTVIANLIRQ